MHAGLAGSATAAAEDATWRSIDRGIGGRAGEMVQSGDGREQRRHVMCGSTRSSGWMHLQQQ